MILIIFMYQVRLIYLRTKYLSNLSITIYPWFKRQFFLICLINIQFESIKILQIMQENNQFKTITNRPICPMPVYFGQGSNQTKFEQPQTLYQPFFEKLTFDRLFSTFQQLKNISKSNLSHQYWSISDRGKDIVKIQASFDQSDEELKSQLKGEYMIKKYRINQQANKLKKIRRQSTANDTKNIPKNFGKAIISFIQKNQKVVARCLKRYNILLQNFIKELKIKKKILHSIRELRSLWLDQDFVYARPFRQLSYYFLRRAGHRYVFYSRVFDFGNHLKYRYRIMKALKCPKTFNSIKI